MKITSLFLVPLLSGTFFIATAHKASDGVGDPEKEKLIMKTVMDGLAQMHFIYTPIDDAFSQKVFDLYMQRMDNNKRFFTQADYDALSVYKLQVDDQIKAGDFTLMNTATTMQDKHIKELETFYEEFLSKKIDFSTKDTYETDGKKIKYAASEDELKIRWAEMLKYSVLDDLNGRLKKETEKKAEEPKKSYDELEAEARNKVLENWRKWSKRVARNDRDDDVEIFVNSVTGSFDPHTSFFPPEDKESFDISMSGKLEGIGAQLKEEDGGTTKVTNIVPGSPSWKQGELKENDVIMKVAQGDAEPVDIKDMPINEVVKLVRGAKGTTVKLTVKKPDGVVKEIVIVRDVVVMDEGYAKSAILKNEETGLTIGLINLPKFYADFDNPSGRRCSRDVKEEIRKLKAEAIDGIVIDLRNNGGGSLNDVVDMGGYFIKDGPIVQVKGREGKAYVMSDRDSRVEYEGPLVILVNQYSASASEILAAALQDYGRAVIVGTTSSFGKGTVQRFISLDEVVPAKEFEKLSPDSKKGDAVLGSLKVTMQKFYRINGGSTQLKGVEPDIILPDVYNYIEVGEKEEDNPMAWSEISPANYKPAESIKNMKNIKKKSASRVKKSDVFKEIEDQALWTKDRRDATAYPLKLEDFQGLEKDLDARSKKYEDVFKDNPNMKIDYLQADASYWTSDEGKKARFEDWQKNLKKDPYMEEAMNVIFDLVDGKTLAKAK